MRLHWLWRRQLLYWNEIHHNKPRHIILRTLHSWQALQVCYVFWFFAFLSNVIRCILLHLLTDDEFFVGVWSSAFSAALSCAHPNTHFKFINFRFRLHIICWKKALNFLKDFWRCDPLNFYKITATLAIQSDQHQLEITHICLSLHCNSMAFVFQWTNWRDLSSQGSVRCTVEFYPLMINVNKKHKKCRKFSYS
jgi:hypothetical protein